MSEKIYVGSGKEFGDYGSIEIGVCLSDLPRRYIMEGKTGKKYIRLIINRRKEPDKYDNTHSVKVKTWKPDNG